MDAEVTLHAYVPSLIHAGLLGLKYADTHHLIQVAGGEMSSERDTRRPVRQEEGERVKVRSTASHRRREIEERARRAVRLWRVRNGFQGR